MVLFYTESQYVQHCDPEIDAAKQNPATDDFINYTHAFLIVICENVLCEKGQLPVS